MMVSLVLEAAEWSSQPVPTYLPTTVPYPARAGIAHAFFPMPLLAFSHAAIFVMSVLAFLFLRPSPRTLV
jgi:hypothetical protein